MIVEATGVGFENKGAQLMVVAIRDQVAGWEPVATLGINFRIGTTAQRKQAGYRSILQLDSRRRIWANTAVSGLATAMPRRLLGATGFVSPSQVDAVLDASGFHFSDQWGLQPVEAKRAQFRRWLARGIPLVLLPQAFGPFEDPAVRAATIDALECSDLIFARDATSLAHVQSLALRRPRVLTSPDFTNLVEPAPLPSHAGRVVIIPNSRMLSMTSAAEGSGYATLMMAIAQSVVDQGHPLSVLVHEPGDAQFAASLVSSVDAPIDEVHLEDPVEIKAVLGGAALVVSSRYHGLVSAMSQGVPAIGTSWSHKYAALFADYECPDGLWNVEATQEVPEQVAMWLDANEQRRRSDALLTRSAALKAESRRMWGEVRACVLSGRRR